MFVPMSFIGTLMHRITVSLRCRNGTPTDRYRAGDRPCRSPCWGARKSTPREFVMRFGGATLRVINAEFDCAAGRGLEAELECAAGRALGKAGRKDHCYQTSAS